MLAHFLMFLFVFVVLREFSESVRVLVLRLNVAVATFSTTCHPDLTTLRALQKRNKCMFGSL